MLDSTEVIVAGIAGHCARLALPVRVDDGRLLVFLDQKTAALACSYGMFDVDADADETPLSDELTGVDAFAGMQRFTVAWETPALV